jgi:hypothetical protein
MADKEKKTSKKKAAVEADGAAGAVTEKAAPPPPAAPKEKLPKNVKKEKLAPKNKSRLPRKQKKAQKNAAAARL